MQKANWSPKPCGFWKLNCDGSVRNCGRSTSCGGILHDHTHEFVYAFSLCLEPCSVIEAILWARPATGELWWRSILSCSFFYRQCYWGRRNVSFSGLNSGPLVCTPFLQYPLSCQLSYQLRISQLVVDLLSSAISHSHPHHQLFQGINNIGAPEIDVQLLKVDREANSVADKLASHFDLFTIYRL